jgi:PAS domain S-box-containing protein
VGFRIRPTGGPDTGDMSSLPRILLVDDDDGDRELASVVLSKEFDRVEIDQVGSATEFSTAIANGLFGLVITEADLEWSDQLEVVSLIRDLRPDCPIILFTRSAGSTLWNEALRLRVDGFVAKSSEGFIQLPSAVRSALFRARRRAMATAKDAPYRRLVEGLPVGVVVSTLSGEILEANPAYAAMLGAPNPEALTRRSITEFFAQTSMASTWRSQIEASRSIDNLDAQLQRIDRSLMWVRISSWVVEDGPRGVHQVQSIVEETEEFHAARDQLARRSQALTRSNAELEQFAYVVSHDLQQPLGMISSYLELLEDAVGDNLDTDARDYFDRAMRGAERLQEMVDAVLGYARVDSRGREFEAIDLNEVVEEVTRDLESSIGATNAHVTHDELPTVMGDGAQLHQVIHNLIGNAIKFVDARRPLVHVGADEDRNDWILSVRDNGIGIAPEASDRIFVMFQRLHTQDEYPGTGIGLAICKRIIERHGGRIWVESRPTRGSTFFFTVPKRTGGEDESTATTAPTPGG